MNKGKFCLWWHAHGLYCGLADEINDKLLAGTSVLANISREAVIEASATFDQTEIIEITAEPETIKKRLLNRGRESVQEVQVRQNRKVHPLYHGSLTVSKNYNDGSAEDTTQKIIERILRLSGEIFEQV